MDAVALVLFELVFWIFSDKYPEAELPGHVVVVFLNILEASVMFSREAEPLCNPANSALGVPFLQVLTGTLRLSTY